MFLIRQSRPDDLEQIVAVAHHLDSVNLPADENRITELLALSRKSFDNTVEPVDREYLFVLEDTEKRRVIGTSMIHAQHGTKRAPHVYFEVFKEERYSQSIDRYFVHEALRLGYNYHGPTEIGGLILSPEYRHRPEHLGRLLSFTRFLFIAMHRQVFRDRVLAELLPPLEPDGTSILWEHLGKHFTGLTYQEADLISKDNKEFIHTLFPQGIIYTALLPQEVRAVIGKVGPETRGVEKMLRRIGFHYARQIDPFDGGPHFVARTDEITTVKDARQATVGAVDSADESRPWAIVAVERGGELRATGSRVIPHRDRTGELGLTEDVRTLLEVNPGDKVWTVTP
jgi:arginine N-succinyltransferase